MGRSGEEGGYQKTGTQSVTTHRHQYDMDVEEMLYGDGGIRRNREEEQEGGGSEPETYWKHVRVSCTVKAMFCTRNIRVKWCSPM